MFRKETNKSATARQLREISCISGKLRLKPLARDLWLLSARLPALEKHKRIHAKQIECIANKMQPTSKVCWLKHASLSHTHFKVFASRKRCRNVGVKPKCMNSLKMLFRACFFYIKIQIASTPHLLRMGLGMFFHLCIIHFFI